MEKIIVLIFLIGILLVSGCSQFPSAKTADTVIRLERGACYGRCSAYSLTIYGNGTVVYEGHKFVKVEGIHTYQMPIESVEKIIAEFEKINYFSLKDRYETEENGMYVTDLPSSTIYIKIGGREKSVFNYYGGPKGLDELEKKIDDLTGVREKFVTVYVFDNMQ